MIKQIPLWKLWQLRGEMTPARFPGINFMGFRFNAEGIHALAIHKEKLQEYPYYLTQSDLNYYKDTWFKVPHVALQIVGESDIIVIGIWATDINPVRVYLDRAVPDVEQLASNRLDPLTFIVDITKPLGE